MQNSHYSTGTCRHDTTAVDCSADQKFEKRYNDKTCDVSCMHYVRVYDTVQYYSLVNHTYNVHVVVVYDGQITTSQIFAAASLQAYRLSRESSRSLALARRSTGPRVRAVYDYSYCTRVPGYGYTRYRIAVYRYSGARMVIDVRRSTDVPSPCTAARVVRCS